MSEYFKSTIAQIIKTTISKLDLVPREEFTTQTQVLIKTRLKVEQLEKKLSALQEQQHQKLDAAARTE